MFSISDAAIIQIKKQVEENKTETLFLRFAATIGTDRSIKYGMGFDELKEDDVQLELGGIKVVLDQTSSDLMDEAKLDFVELEEKDFQFIFINPLDPNYVPSKS